VIIVCFIFVILRLRFSNELQHKHGSIQDDQSLPQFFGVQKRLAAQSLQPAEPDQMCECVDCLFFKMPTHQASCAPVASNPSSERQQSQQRRRISQVIRIEGQVAGLRPASKRRITARSASEARAVSVMSWCFPYQPRPGTERHPLDHLTE